jgi:hypothetical protein
LLGGDSDARVGAEGRQAWPSVLPELSGSFSHDRSEHPAEGESSAPSLVSEQRQILVAGDDSRSTFVHDADYTSDAFTAGAPNVAGLRNIRSSPSSRRPKRNDSVDRHSPKNARDPNVEPGLIGLEYWFFYPYNYYPTIISSSLMEEAPIAGEHLNTDLHQGDWEHVTVLLEPGTFAPRWLYMARHADEGSFLPWDSPTLSFDGTHPIAQAAYGGHPTYDNRCGARPRGKVRYLSSDWVICGGGRYAFRASSTPLVDLAHTEWGAGRAASGRPRSGLYRSNWWKNRTTWSRKGSS